MRELRLKYFLELVSNIGTKSQQDAQAMEAAQRRIKDAMTGTTDRFAALDRAITKVGTNTGTERQISYMQRLASVIDQASSKATRLRQAMAQGIDKAPEKFAEASAGYYGAKTVMAPPIRAFSSLESATEDLRISMMKADGKVSKDFDKISAEAVKLGNQLPGTTKDFMLAARSLTTQGVPTSVVANGGLRASSYVGALLNLDQERSAEVIAKLREAHGLKDDQLVPMADLVQRGFFGFGIKPQDYLETAKYAASTYNAMGITGYEQAKETLAIQGMAANVGLEGSSFGTNYAQMLTRMSQIENRKNRNSKEAKEVRELLGGHGIDMQFYNDEGVFKGNLNMMQQLSKLRSLNPLEQVKVLNRLFGVEASRPAQILVQKGLEGYHAARETIDSQANLDQRIAVKMETFAAKLESLAGTIENVQARIATQTGQALKPVMDGANSLLGGSVDSFFKNNPGAGTATLAAGGAAGAYLMGRMGGALWKALILRGAPEAAAGTVAGGAASAGAAGGAASAGAAASGISAAARAARMLKYGGITAAIGAGLEGVSIMADEKADKPRELSRLGVTTGMGVLGGALSGAAMGSVLPGLGTLLGAIAGGLAGSFGSGALFDLMWAKKTPEQRQAGLAGTLPPDVALKMAGLNPALGGVPLLDLLTLTAPGTASTQLTAGKTAEVKVGEGTLDINVRVTDDRVSATSSVMRPLSLVRINPGATNPGGFGQ